MLWIKKEIDAHKAREIAERYGIDLALAVILLRRGIESPEDITFCLENDVRFMHNPFLFKDMARTVDRLRRAIAAREKILVYGDRDVDGITATVLLAEALAEHGADVVWKVPLGDDDYGLSLKDVEEAASLGVTLLCTVDCGISNLKEIDYAGEKGIEVIVIDHHNPQPELPRSFAVINPKVPGSGYPFATLCGCGVASKLDWALAFSDTSLYDRPQTLLHLTPLNASYAVEAVRYCNLARVGSFRENVTEGMGAPFLERLRAFAAGSEIIVHDLREQRPLVEKLWGEAGAGLVLADFQERLAAVFPALRGKSLLAIREMSRIGKYSGTEAGEMETFRNLYVSALDKETREATARTRSRFDLAALGTIADLMPLVNENRIIVRQGLALLPATGRHGLRALLSTRNLLGRELTVKDVAWQVSPIINASGRLGEPDKAVELLLAREAAQAEGLTEYLCSLNEKRKTLGDISWKKHFDAARESFDKTGGKFVLVTGDAIHRGITGILATRFLRHFKVPVCVVAELEAKAVGSLRSVPEFHLAPFLRRFADLFTDSGGHDLAAGFSLPRERLGAFRDRLYDLVGTFDLLPEKEDTLAVDAEIPPSLLTPDLYALVERLAPYGEAHPPLQFFTAGLAVDSCDVVGKREQAHLKLVLNTGTYRFPSMLWNGAELYGDRFKVGERIDLVYRMQKNHYMNTESIQLVISDLARAGERPLRTVRADEELFDSARVIDL